MNSKIYALFLIWFGVAPQLAMADSALNRDLIKRSGIESVVAQIPPAMSASYLQLEQHGVKPDEKFKTAWVNAVKASIRADRIVDAIDKGLQKLTVAERRSVLAFYDTPAGQRIRTLEEKASQPDAQPAIEAFAKTFMADPKNAERLKLYQQIDRATHGSILGTELGLRVAHATALGMANATRGPATIDQAALEKQVESQRPQIAQQVQQVVLLTSAFTYRDLTVAEIKAYLKFLTTPATQKFSTVVLNSLTNELATQARLFGSELVKNFRRKSA